MNVKGLSVALRANTAIFPKNKSRFWLLWQKQLHFTETLQSEETSIPNRTINAVTFLFTHRMSCAIGFQGATISLSAFEVSEQSDIFLTLW